MWLGSSISIPAQKLKRYKSSGIDQIPTIDPSRRKNILKPSSLLWNKEEFHSSGGIL
jgi:hypothetical protein